MKPRSSNRERSGGTFGADVSGLPKPMNRVSLQLRMVPRPVRLLSALIVTSAAIASASCDKMPLTAPAGSAIVLNVSTNILPVNGSVEILAMVLEGALGTSTGNQPPTVNTGVGTPVHNNTLVIFTTTLGRIEPAEARTEAGRAKVRLIADGRSGTATVTAISGGARATADVRIGAAGAARIAVTASPQALPATGGQSTISARVEDQQGNGLLGVPVSFSTTAGSLAAASIVTDANGVATTTLTTNAAATVTATAGGGSGTTAGPTPATVAITIKPRTTLTLTVPGTASISTPTSITVNVGANTIVTDVVLDFGDGETAPLGALSGSTNVVHLYGDADVFTVTATATDSDGIRTSVSSQLAVLPISATATASPSTVTFGQSVLFSVTVPASAAIRSYTWNLGEGDTFSTNSPQQSVVYNSRGTKSVVISVNPLKGDPIVIRLQVNVQ